jgi:osmoprotectant transport system ATP-binding protein
LPAALEAIAVSKRYRNGFEALSDVSLEVKVGETVALIGESGSGKTTLLRLFNRLDEPTQGEVRIDGRQATLENPIELRRSTGYVQQDGGLLPHWSVGRNVELVPSLLGWEPSRRRSRCDELLELLGLAPDRFRSLFPAQLSGGQRQRVAVARALAADPAVILLDEPFGALDALTRLDVQDAVLELRQRLRKTMVLVTHDLREAFRLADRVGVLRAGRLLQLGAPSELAARPADAYVAALLAHAGGAVA